jgi:hypothetical protein
VHELKNLNQDMMKKAEVKVVEEEVRPVESVVDLEKEAEREKAY